MTDININGIAMDDWSKLSAYHDGELSDELRADVTARLRQDPEFRAMLVQIEALSSRLKSLRPATAALFDTGVPLRGTMLRSPLALITATTVAVVVSGAVFLGLTGQGQSAASWHREFLTRNYAASAPDASIRVTAQGFSQLPDLSPAGLTLVAMRSGRDGVEAYHFAGQNSCRLTVLVGADIKPGETVGDLMLRTWKAGSLNYAAVAAKMDEDRFEVIVQYLEHLTQQDSSTKDILAMRTANEAAVRCG
jgi:anti-sigma factor RsiW